MFEAVGLHRYDEFFRACDRLLGPDGSMLIQTITINEQTFPAYRRRADFIQKHIFPGSELASVSEILQSLARATSLSLYHAEDIGTHYAEPGSDHAGIAKVSHSHVRFAPHHGWDTNTLSSELARPSAGLDDRDQALGAALSLR